jgi:hypothetical protein
LLDATAIMGGTPTPANVLMVDEITALTTQ